MNGVRLKSKDRFLAEACEYLVTPEDSLIPTATVVCKGARRLWNLAVLKFWIWWAVAVALPLIFFGKGAG